MRNKIIILVILIVLVCFVLIFYFALAKISRCVPVFKHAKNLYSINMSINKDYFNNGDWYEFYEGQLYSNYDYQRDADLHREVLEYRNKSGASLIIYPNHIAANVKEEYECSGKDSDFCSNLIMNRLQEIKDAGFLKLSDEDIKNIGQAAEENSIITEVGFLQLGLIKIPPMKWLSYHDSGCIDLDNASPNIVLFGKIVLFSNRSVNYLISAITVLIVLFLLGLYIIKRRKASLIF